MEKTKFLRIVILVLCIITSQISFGKRHKKIVGNGNIVEQKIEVDHFNKVSVNRGIIVVLKKSIDYVVCVKTDENIQPYVSIENVNGQLNIGFENENNKDYQGTIEVAISLPNIDGIETSSGAKVSSIDLWGNTILRLDASSGSTIQLNTEVDRLIAKTSSSGMIDIDCKADDVRLESSSSGKINVDGTTPYVALGVSSGGKIDADNLIADKGNVVASSGGHAECKVLEECCADASSGGVVVLINNPKIFNKESSSGGRVIVR